MDLLPGEQIAPKFGGSSDPDFSHIEPAIKSLPFLLFRRQLGSLND